MAFENINVTTEAAVGLIQLNRPNVLNALNSRVMTELTRALEEFDANDSVRCIVIHGNARAFSAGADIDEMKSATPVEMLKKHWIAYWDRLKKVGKPIIAAV